MLHPVLPPEPPLIREPLERANPIPMTADTQSKSVVKLALGTAGDDSTENELVVPKTLSAPSTPETFPAEFSPLTPVNSAAFLGQQLSVGYPLQQVEVSGSHDGSNPQISAQTSPPTEQVYPTLTHSKNLSQTKARFLVEKLAQAQQHSSDAHTENSALAERALCLKVAPRLCPVPLAQGEGSSKEPSGHIRAIAPIQQPITINFNSTGETNQPPTPSTIEFKSRNQTTEEHTGPTPTAPKLSPPISQSGTTTGEKSQPSAQTPPANTPPQTRRVIEVIADRQEYDEDRHIVTAVGNVVVRFDGSIVNADRLQASLDNLIAVGEGNVTLTRGDQLLRGQSFTYNFIQDSGQLQNGRGEVFIPSTQRDFAFLPTDVSEGGVPQTPLSDRVKANQPVQVTNSPGGINITVGGGRGASNLPIQKDGGVVKRLRFEAVNIDFYPRGWQARDVRITNDPFSPPELVLRADKVTLTRESPLRDRIKTVRQRLVFDQRVTLPIPKDEQTIDRSQRDTTPAIASLGYDGTDRGGLFIERSFKPLNLEGVNFSITPQFFVQKAVQNFSNPADLFGIKTRLTAVVSPKTVVEGFGNLTSLDFSKVDTNLRANLRLRQSFGDESKPHTLALEYTYRDRLYNGSLGFQTVQSSLGGVITSPIIPLGKSGINLSYQAGVQSINANTDRQDLLKPNRDSDRITLTRLQGSIALSGGVPLWQGKPLPPTATEGLRYTANPVVPYLNANAGVTGTNSYYSNGDDQSTITGTVGLSGQLGHFSRPFLDYTAFNISYSQGINNGLSPFLFDRSVDNKVLNVGITQQIYGPFRFGFQTSINLDTRKSTSTDYVLEYSRRTYGITFRYNPDLQLGGISFRISDFNWTGGTDPFSDNSQLKPVVNGVRRDY